MFDLSADSDLMLCNEKLLHFFIIQTSKTYGYFVQYSNNFNPYFYHTLRIYPLTF